MKGATLGKLLFECPRCGDTLECATTDDIFLATTHRLLHISGDWKQSMRPAAYWSLDRKESTPPVPGTQ
jgi:hypothetical protein